jgi:hypothetical protein
MRAGERRETDADPPPSTVRGVSAEREARQESGAAGGINPIAHARRLIP